MTRCLPIVLVFLFTLPMGGCKQPVTVDVAASLWVLEVMGGQCKSAIPYRAREVKIPESPTYYVVRSMHCPVRGDVSGDVIELLQLRAADGEFFWVESEDVKR